MARRTGTPPTLAVAVCSAGRPKLLEGCLSSLAALPGWAEGDEVVVVLNGAARDEARSVVESSDMAQATPTPSIGTRPVLEVVEEPTPSLSLARNLAWRATDADVVAFLDDDARPADRWLDGWRTAFAQHPDLLAAGGPIRLRWPMIDNHPPPWFDPRLGAYWSALDLTPEQVDRTPGGGRAFGANLAVRRTALEHIGGFDERLGRGAATTIRGGEDTDLLERLAPGRIGWVDTAAVEHLVGTDRARLRWLLGRAHEQGRHDRAFGATRSSRRTVVTSGWATLAREVRRHPGGWRSALAVDLARRARLAGRSVSG